MSTPTKWFLGIWVVIVDLFLLYAAVVLCFIHQRVGFSRGGARGGPSIVTGGAAIAYGFLFLAFAAIVTWRFILMANGDD